MGLIFRKRIKIMPGVKLNLSKSGVSTTIGGKGGSFNIGKRGAFVNAGIPGTGVSYRAKVGQRNQQSSYNHALNNTNMYKQTYGLPAVLSFFIPGLGQLLKGEILKGVAIWIIGGLLSIFLWWTFIVPLGIWIWNIYDAYNSNPKS